MGFYGNIVATDIEARAILENKPGFKNNKVIGAEIFNDYINNKAEGRYSTALGQNTIASADYSWVQGKYNINDLTKQYLQIVGNGISDNKRSNAYTLDFEGNGWYQGKVSAIDFIIENQSISDRLQNIDNSISNLTDSYQELLADFDAALKLLGGHESWVN